MPNRQAMLIWVDGCAQACCSVMTGALCRADVLAAKAFVVRLDLGHLVLGLLDDI